MSTRGSLPWQRFRSWTAAEYAGGVGTSFPSVAAPIVSVILAHAFSIGLALLLAGIVFAFVGRALSRIALGAGLVATAALAYRAWPGPHDWLAVAAILLAGLAASGAVAALLRWVTAIFEIGSFAAGWYLVVYARMGPGFLATNAGLATWGMAAVVTAFLVDRAVRRRALLRTIVPRTVLTGLG